MSYGANPTGGGNTQLAISGNQPTSNSDRFPGSKGDQLIYDQRLTDARVGAITAAALGGAVVHAKAGNLGSNKISVVAKLDGAANVRLAVSESAALASPIYSAAVTPDADGMARMDVVGLEPATAYHWRVEADGDLDQHWRGTLQYARVSLLYPPKYAF